MIRYLCELHEYNHNYNMYNKNSKKHI